MNYEAGPPERGNAASVKSPHSLVTFLPRYERISYISRVCQSLTDFVALVVRII